MTLKVANDNTTLAMLTIKNPVLFLLIAALALSACAPSGPRALVDGKRRLDKGKYEEAIPKLEFAAEALKTNAVAWNFLGLAYHHAGRVADAKRVYLKALTIDRSLSEARYNLGCLYLEQNNLHEAKSAFTAYTIERDNDVFGFLRLGSASSRAGDLSGAERAFQNALRISPENPEALTGLGVLRQKKSRPVEAAEFFTRALKSDPQFAPAIYNYAVVAQQGLKDRPLALRLYQQYLALKPAPPNTGVVIVAASELQRELANPATAAKPSALAVAGAGTSGKPNTTQSAGTRPSEVARPPAALSATNQPLAARPNATNSGPLPAQPSVVVKVQPQPEIKIGTDVKPSAPVIAAPQIATSQQAEPKPAKRSMFSRLFGSKASEPMSVSPGSTNAVRPAVPVASARYLYLNPPRPASGNRARAERVFADAVSARQQRRVSDAVKLYRQAAQLDPSFFNAHYNLALVLTELGESENAARAYEFAIAARPDSVDARYNFALLLKQMGCYADSIKELEKLLVVNPSDARAQVMLGNIYSQQMKQAAKAREHYTRALEIDPQNSQAAAIRQWLVDPRN